MTINEHSEIKSKVLHFVEVLARPLVMYQTVHPVHWSPAYVGGRVRIYCLFIGLTINAFSLYWHAKMAIR